MVSKRQEQAESERVYKILSCHCERPLGRWQSTASLTQIFAHNDDRTRDFRTDVRAILSHICGLILAKSRKNLHCLRGVFVDSKFKRTCIILFLHML